MIGQANQNAITNGEFYELSKWRLWKERQKAVIRYNSWKEKLIKRLKSNEAYLLTRKFDGMLFEELWLHHYNSYLQMDDVLSGNHGLSVFLWKIGLNGVSDSNFDQVIKRFPPEFICLIDQEKMYSDQPITSMDAFNLFDFPLTGGIVLSAVRRIIKVKNIIS